MDLFRLPERPPDWDARIRKFPNKSFGHESAWLDYICSALPGVRIEYFEIRDAGRVVGYFCIARVRKFLYSIFRSPLAGPGRHLGPAIEPHVDQGEFVRCLIRFCRSNRIHHVEISNDWLDESLMRQLGFQVSVDTARVCPLDGGQGAVWARMKGGCRTRIRKAENSGLCAEATNDPQIVEVFYSQFAELLKRKRLPVPYTLATVRALFRHLAPADRLFAIRVTQGNRVIATGLYPHNEDVVYHMDSGYDPEYMHLSSNELLHWTAMKLAMERGIPLFQMSAGKPSRFTQKFGGTDRPYLVYRKNLLPFVEAARTAYLFGRGIARAAVARSASWSGTAHRAASLDLPGAGPGTGDSDDRVNPARWLVIVQPNHDEIYQLLRHRIHDVAPVVMERHRPSREPVPAHERRRAGKARAVATIYAYETGAEDTRPTRRSATSTAADAVR